MYLFKSTKTYNSKLFEGVSVTLRKMTESRRLDLQLKTAGPTQEIRELLGEQRSLDTIKDSLRIMTINDQINRIITEKLNPAKIRWGVSAIHSLMLDDEPATLDNVMSWPSDLIDELINLIDDGSALNEVEQKNFESLITSGAQVEAKTKDTSAQSASSDDIDSTSSGIAKNFLN